MARYLTDGFIGYGGMATVWSGWRRLGDGKRLRVGMKRPRGGAEAVERLCREAEFGLALGHPNLIKIYDLDRDSKGLFIAMEYVPGCSLGELSKRAEVSPQLVRLILVRLLVVLGYLHELGVIHGDISPSNILLCRDGGVRLIDLGLARRIGQPPAGRQFKGTMAYASPEAREGQELDGSSDLYSLAAVIQEALGTDMPIDLRAFVDGLLQVREERRWHDTSAALAAWLQFEAEVADSNGLAAIIQGLGLPGPQPIDAAPADARRRWRPIAAVALTLSAIALAALIWRANTQPPSSESVAVPQEAESLVCVGGDGDVVAPEAAEVSADNDAPQRDGQHDRGAIDEIRPGRSSQPAGHRESKSRKTQFRTIREFEIPW